MPRKGPAPKRPVVADPVYGAPIVSQLVNKILLDGKKGLAERIVYGAFDIVKEKSDSDPLSVFKKAMDNVRPTLEVKPKRVGGATYQVPVEVKSDRRQSLAMRWLLISARSRSGKPMFERLAAELMDAFNNTGSTIKRKEDVQRMAEANRAFSHYGKF